MCVDEEDARRYLRFEDELLSLTDLLRVGGNSVVTSVHENRYERRRAVGCHWLETGLSDSVLTKRTQRNGTTILECRTRFR